MIDFIDLFSGIGGFRKGLEDCGNRESHGEDSRPEGNQFNGVGGANKHGSPYSFRCVWSNDFNKYANQVYTKHFGEENHHPGDIRGVNPQDIPDFDLVCAGFPCQSFSVAGKRKGFQDTRGTLFFEICRIVEAKRPSLLLLENVKGLLNHDGGRTFTIILQALDELGYWVEWQVLNSKHHGVPQNRERVFIVGHLRGTGGREIFPIGETGEDAPRTQEKTHREGAWIWDENSGVAGSLRVGGSGIEENLIANTISKRYYKDGSENLIYGHPRNYQRKGLYEGDDIYRSLRTTQRPPPPNYPYTDDVLLGKRKVRRLTPTECERLQGFPDGWTAELSDTQRYKCLGNAVTVNVIEFLGKQIMSSFTNKADPDD